MERPARGSARRWGRWGGALLAAVLLTSPLSGQEGDGTREISSAAPSPSGPLRVLDVPYLPQTEALCGGAAAAMVMRYWGGDVSPSHFADLVRPDEGGIRTDELAAEVRAMGWRARRVAATPEAARAHVSEGRPVILLLRVAPGRFHYVTVVAARGGEWLVHDPARAPYRRLSDDELLARWDPSGRWGLVLVPGGTVDSAGRGAANAPPAGPPDEPVPPPGSAPRSEGTPEGASPGDAGRCAERVVIGVRAARDGRLRRADAQLREAVAACPRSAAAPRELAGLRFRQGRWRASAALAERALAIAPDDAHALRTLASARFMAGDELGALSAWNRLDEPRLAGLRVYGLRRTRYRVLRRQTGLSAGRALSDGDLQAVRRRVAAVPAVAASRVDYRPPERGRTELEVALVERPLLPSPIPALAAAGLRAATERALQARTASPAGAGELWSGSWSWWEERPHLRVRLAAPAAFGVPGVWEVRGTWRRAAFAEGDGATGSVAREEVRRAALSLARWVSGSLRLTAGLALEAWSRPGDGEGPGRRAGLDLEGVARDDGAGVAIRGSVGGRVGPGADFWRVGLEARGRWSGPGSPGSRPLTLRARAGVEAAGAGSPRMSWPGAGTGHVRRPLLRAHPLVRDGVVSGPAFGRVLVHAGMEPAVELPVSLPVSLRAAAFLDAARAWHGTAGGDRWLLDAGAGLRLGLPGIGGRVRLDAALGLVDGSEAVSVGWEAPWPGW